MRKTIIYSLIVSLFCIFTCFSNANADPMVIKIATAYPADGIPVKTLYAMADAIEKRSNGKYKVEIYDNFKLGSIATCIQALQSGTIQMDMDATTQLAAFAPKLSIFDVPYLTESYDKNAVKVMQGEEAQKLLAAGSTRRMLILDVFTVTSRFLETLKPVHSLEDAKDLKMRTTQSKMHVEIMKALGMAPIPMTSSEVMTSIQQGVIEGLDYNLNTSITWKYETLAPYWAKFDHQLCVGVMCVNRNWWEKTLTAEDRAFLGGIVKEFANKNMEEEFSYDEREMARLKAEGHPVFVPSKEEKARWIEATKNVHKEFPKDVDADVVDKIRGEYAKLNAQ